MEGHAQRMGEVAAYLRSRQDGDYMDKDAAIYCDQAMHELVKQQARIAELEARCAKAETKAAISQITAETERRLRESAEKDLERECLWSSDGFNDLWESSCGMAWTFPDEGPKENDMTYCPKCRGVLIVDTLTEGGEHG